VFRRRDRRRSDHRSLADFRNYVADAPSRRSLHRVAAETRLDPTNPERIDPNTSPTHLARECDGKRIRSRRALARSTTQHRTRQATLWAESPASLAPTRPRKLRSPISQRSHAIQPPTRGLMRQVRGRRDLSSPRLANASFLL
jgi:hypothetical protein